MSPLPSPAGHGSFGCEGCIPDSVNHAKTVRDLYELASDTGGESGLIKMVDSPHKLLLPRNPPYGT